jgi:hypothetical protein
MTEMLAKIAAEILIAGIVALVTHLMRRALRPAS